jgi:hypothetical protein
MTGQTGDDSLAEQAALGRVPGQFRGLPAGRFGFDEDARGDPWSETTPSPWVPVGDPYDGTAQGTAPVAADPEPRPRELRAALGRVRWEVATLAVLVLAPQVVGLFGCLVGAAMTGRSRFWEATDKARALLGIPAAWLVIVLLRAWVTATWIRPAPSSMARLKVAGGSLSGSFHYGPGVIGLVAAAYLGVLVVRDARWS